LQEEQAILFQGAKQLQQTVESNKTLLIDGPARVQVISGVAEVFGKPLKSEARIVVRQGKRLPFIALEKTVFDVSLGANASMQEVAGSTVPASWNTPIEAALSVKQKPVTVLILGKNDSGKSSFCTYLLNKLVGEKCKVAVLDGDIGQSDIGPSGTVGYGTASKPVSGLYHLRLQNAFFIGVTSPILAIAKTIEGLTAMKAEALQKQVDFLLVNTDGWVTDNIAIRYKTALVEALKPDVVVGVQVKDELDQLIAALDTPVMKVEPSAYLSPRTIEKRKTLREMTYARYLKASKVQCYPLSQVIVEPKAALPKKQEPEKGLLVALYNGTKFLGIGVLRRINHVRKVLKIQTSVTRTPKKIFIGKVLLDKKLREIQD
jgi:polynucleotide 5'-hydroxyl-kinase GRC3/NOL9